MTDNARRRRSKWDVTVEPNFPGESRDEVRSGPNSLNLDIPQEVVVMRPSDDFSRMDKPPKRAATDQAEGKNSLGERDSRNQMVRDGLVPREMGGRGSASYQEYGSGRSPGRDAWRRRSHNVSPRGGGRGRSGRSRSRSRSRGRSMSRSRSRSRSRSWSRSRSRSPFSMNRGSARGRNRAGGGQGPPCRDFATGRCRRGAQCRFLHEDGGRGEFDRYHTHPREAKLERGSSWRSSKESLTSPRDQNDHSRNRPLQRQQSQYDDGDRGKSDSHRIDKPSDLCFDFTKGRCQRGSSCRYLHHETSSRGGWSTKDESRDENYDKMDPDVSFGQRSEPRGRNEPTCKFFAEGRCRRAQNCRFSHLGIDSMGSGLDGCEAQEYDQVTGDSLSKDFPDLGDQTVAMDAISPSQWTNGATDGLRAAPSLSLEMADSTQKRQHQQSRKTEDDDVPQMSVSKVHRELDSRVLDESADLREFSSNSDVLHQKGGSVIPDHSATKPEMNPVPSAAGQSFRLGRPSQFISQQLHAQNFVPGIQIPQVVSPLPFNGQMQQVAYPMPPNGQSQFAIPPTSDAQQLNLNMQSQHAISGQHSVKNQQNPGDKSRQNVARTVQNGPNQQSIILSAHNPQFFQSAVKGQSLHELHPDGQVQQNVLPLNGQSSHNIGDSGPNHQGTIPSHHGQNQNPSMVLPSNNSFKSDNHPTSFVRGEGSFSSSGASEIKPSLMGSASAISHKVVTSEQAAQITNLSASLAQFFGNASLNVTSSLMPSSQNSCFTSATLPAGAIPPTIQPSQGSARDDQHGAIPNDAVPVKLEISELPTDPRLQISEKISNSSLPVPVIDHSGKHENCDATQIEPSDNDPVKEVNGTEIGGHDRENEEKTQDAGADAADGEIKQGKDAKASKMFKYALAEFVKDMLKPAWKEGQLSREAHKTIVKKVVDKVTGAIQGPNIPQTQEKIDIYLTHSKAKLSKLVQAYVEKYVKN